MNGSSEEKKKKIRSLDCVRGVRKVRYPTWGEYAGYIQFGIGKEVRYILNSVFLLKVIGLNKNLNVICLDIMSDYDREKKHYKKLIQKLDEITNIHPNIKDFFNIPIKKSEVYL